VRAAFWLKASEDSRWYLYIASDRITDQRIRAGYAEVGRASEAIQDPNFDPFRVKLINVGDPLAQAALALYRRTQARVPMHSGADPLAVRASKGFTSTRHRLPWRARRNQAHLSDSIPSLPYDRPTAGRTFGHARRRYTRYATSTTREVSARRNPMEPQTREESFGVLTCLSHLISCF
jgi:hypothetical protein